MAERDRHPEIQYLQSITWNDNSPQNEQEFIPVLSLAYSLLEVRDEENDAFTLQCSFFAKTAAEFQALVANIPPDYNIAQDFIGCYKLLQMSIHHPGRLTREAATRLGQYMTDADLNNKLKTYARQIKNQPLAPVITFFECYQICLVEILKPLTHVYKKSILAGKAYQSIKSWSNKVKIFRPQVTAMFVALSDKADINRAATSIVQSRTESINLFTEYLDFGSDDLRQRLPIHYIDLVEQTPVFSYQTLKAAITNRTIFTNNCYAATENQLLHLLDDEEVLATSNELDNLVGVSFL